ncbi:MAG: hypothetical protein SF097_15505 [Acidobacteriota bacterium]|nr:hypothetical protein [Acidobacteriota bacterium]
MSNEVRDFLVEKGCPLNVAERGLIGLIESWEKVVQSVENGYSLTLDDYLNDLDARQLLEEALDVATMAERINLETRIMHADDLMKGLTRRASVCLWGDELAEEESWNSKKNWWYYACPVDADAELLAEIAEVTGET